MESKRKFGKLDPSPSVKVTLMSSGTSPELSMSLIVNNATRCEPGGQFSGVLSSPVASIVFDGVALPPAFMVSDATPVATTAPAVTYHLFFMFVSWLF
jgi:hypothetical protein